MTIFLPDSDEPLIGYGRPPAATRFWPGVSGNPKGRPKGARVGEALHPARESVETLEKIRQTIGTYNFAGQYQQSPAPPGGGMVKEQWFRRYDPMTLDQKFDRIVQSWDTANKPTELADYSVCTTWGIKSDHFYLLNFFRKKLAYPDLKRAVIEQKHLFNPTTILIEDKASGTQLIQDLIDGGLSMVLRFKPDGDKIMRLHAQTATIENGFVHLPNAAHWLADYLHELTVFPNGRYDDQVDSTAQALAWTKLRPAGWGAYECYRLEAERAAGKTSPATIRLKAPPGISHVCTISGQQIAVRDGFVDVIEGEHLPFLGPGSQYGRRHKVKPRPKRPDPRTALQGRKSRFRKDYGQTRNGDSAPVRQSAFG